MYSAKKNEDKNNFVNSSNTTQSTIKQLLSITSKNIDNIIETLHRINNFSELKDKKYKDNVYLLNDITQLIKNGSIDKISYSYISNINSCIAKINKDLNHFLSNKRNNTITSINNNLNKTTYSKNFNSLTKLYDVGMEEDLSNHTTIIIEFIYNGLKTYLDTQKHYLSELTSMEAQILKLDSINESKSKIIKDIETKLIQDNNELKTKITTLTSTQEELKNTSAALTSTQEQLEETHNELTINKHRFQKLTTDYENLKSAPTVKVYSDSTDKYRKLEKLYRRFFLGTIIIFILLATLTVFYKSYILGLLTTIPNSLSSSLIEFWSIKISIILIGITLASYFLKLSSHYQRLADQSHQTEVELKAYPTFIHDLSPEESAQLRKELALKYFGKDVDSTPHKALSNLITDQMKSTTELVKATASMIKKQ